MPVRPEDKAGAVTVVLIGPDSVAGCKAGAPVKEVSETIGLGEEVNADATGGTKASCTGLGLDVNATAFRSKPKNRYCSTGANESAYSPAIVPRTIRRGWLSALPFITFFEETGKIAA